MMSLDFDLEMEMLTNVFASNITHNLGKMASEAGIYDCLWRAHENGFTKAKQIIQILEKGIEEMKFDPEHFRKFDSENGWGTYDDFLPWLEKVLAACKEFPESKIDTSR